MLKVLTHRFRLYCSIVSRNLLEYYTLATSVYFAWIRRQWTHTEEHFAVAVVGLPRSANIHGKYIENFH